MFEIKAGLFRGWILGSLVAGLVGCSSIKPEAIDSTADVQSELAKTEGNLANAKAEQVDVLAPESFAQAEREYRDAKRARDNGDDSEKVFASLGKSRAYLKKANEAASLTKTGMAETQKARAAALAAGAGERRGDEFAALDKRLMNITESAEGGNIDRIREHDEQLSKKYRELEVQSIKETHLAAARGQMDQAAKEDAKKWAPRTLEQADAQYKALDEFIGANPHDPSIAQKATALNAATTNLVNVTREAKKFEKTDAESLVLQKQQADKTVSAQQEQLAASSTALSATEQALSATEQQARAYEQENAFDRKFEEARATFSPAEAEVFRQGNTLTVRLKNLAFKVGQAGIAAENFEVLKKVDDVIHKFEAPRIVVEGHTDSTGSKDRNMKLSQERAEAVANYLVSQGTPQASVSTIGHGSEKPVANNKTKEGRALNRRVDIIIDSRRESVSL